MKYKQDMARSVRRHHVARLKKSRGNYYRFNGKMTPRQLGKVVATPRDCSCWMCGNPRNKRWLTDFPKGKTLQEMKQFGYADSSEEELWQVE